ncbi:SsgA family sporulation/cell division regulator [Streptomyces sp. URMC 123]|uniref:SsgA family sporulation/cell division regulator n=1 Tax=Streptomyces sp. URMC 123 TaxID=3423403 RepID=UPI003F1D984C
MTHTVVARELPFDLVLAPARSVRVPARLTYRTDDPYAVHITFHIGSPTPVDWAFARELLAEGLRRPSGRGDVRIWPVRAAAGGGTLCVALSSPEGEALLETAAAPVAAWLERTLRVVPPGREHERMSLDGVLDELLGPHSST